MECLIDIQKTCRTCLEEGELKNIFENYIDGLKIQYILRTIVPVSIVESDLLSNKMCYSCINKMTLSHHFLEMSIKSDRDVRNALEGSSEVEDIEETIIELDPKDEIEEFGTETPKLELVETFDQPISFEEIIECKVILKKTDSTSSKEQSANEFDESEEYLDSNPEVSEEKVKSKLLCIFCTKEFSTTSLLTLHLKSHKLNLDNKIFSCSPCGNIVFETLDELQTHSETHRMNFECEICSEKFTLIEDYTNHQENHSETSVFKCQICFIPFDKKEKLKKHLRQHNIGKKYSCNQCDKIYNDSSNLKRHLIRHSGIRNHICHRCPQKFAFSSELKSHLKTHENFQPHQCHVCSKSFSKSSSLIQHIRIHTKERPFACDFCKNAFISADHLRRHARTHTNEKPYKCKIEYCNKAFIQRQDWVKHMKAHNGANFYTCEICSMGFSMQTQLKAHWATHYPAIEESATEGDVHIEL